MLFASVPQVVTGTLSPHAKLVHSGRQRGYRYEIYYDPHPSERTFTWRDGQTSVSRTRADLAQQRPYVAVTYYPYGGSRGIVGGLFTRGEEAEAIDRSRSLEGARRQAEAYIERMWKSQHKEESEFRRHARQKREALHRGEPYGTPHRYVRGRRDPGLQSGGQSMRLLENPLTHFELGALVVGGTMVLGALAYALWPKSAAAGPAPAPGHPAFGGGSWPLVQAQADGSYVLGPGTYGVHTSGLTADQVKILATQLGAVATARPSDWPADDPTADGADDVYFLFSVSTPNTRVNPNAGSGVRRHVLGA